ncbi:MAG TPA: ABC transporter permease [Prolixibacteraceae bacterium]|nr:ABC transporter permease [Prolixibacteraceae bacterium]
MNKSILILKREYLTRVKKKSFIVMTLLVPLMMAALTILPTYLAMMDDKEERTIAVYDPTGLILNQLESNEFTKFHYIPGPEFQELSKNFKSGNYYAVLHIPENILTTNRAEMISDKQVTFDIKNLVTRRIENIIEGEKRKQVIDETGVPDLEKRLSATKTDIRVETIKLGEKGEAVKSSTEIAMVMGYIAGLLIYMFVFIYGAMVMRGVMEEKSNRIVEVIISSVKPFQLLFGKIIGIGLVGLTQIVIWIVLTLVITAGATTFIGQGSAETASQAQNIMSGSQAMGQMATATPEAQNKVIEIIGMIGNLNIPLIIFALFFYFIGGFILYASFMGAIGAAVDSDEDAQQLMMPVMMPLIFSVILLFAVAKNPEGQLAFWASMIPLTSPVIMMVRIPFGAPAWQIILSMVILLGTILGSIWMAGKIYRTGILMYGKKVTIKEVFKWLFYKN